MKQFFMEAFNRRAEIKEETLSACEEAIAAVSQSEDLDAQIQALQQQNDDLSEKSQKLMEENSRGALDENDYKRRYADYLQCYDAQVQKLEQLQREKKRRSGMKMSIEWFMERFRAQDGLLTEFDDELFFAVTDIMTAHRDGTVTVRFRDGAEVDVKCKQNTTKKKDG